MLPKVLKVVFRRVDGIAVVVAALVVRARKREEFLGNNPIKVPVLHAL
jgi:hypothetical protein